MKKQTLYLLLILLNLQFTACSQNDSLKGGELYSSNFLIDGVQRNFTYYMPINYGKKDQYPLVIFLHGMGATGKNIIKSYGSRIHAMADETNYIVIYPDAVVGHWNDKMGGSFPATDTINDVGFISILIDYFRDVYNCDAKRVYVAGFSNGGELAYRLSCDIPFKITAIAPFISAMGTEAAQQFTNAEPLPVMITNGTIDPIVKWQGGAVTTAMHKEPLAILLSVDSSITYWKKRNGITQPADSTLLPDACPEDSSTVIKYTYKGNEDVVVYKVINGVHAIPIKNKAPKQRGENCDYDAIGEAWNFFIEHTKK